MPRLIAIDLGSHQVKVARWRLSGRAEPVLEERVAVHVPQGGSAPGLEPRLAALDALLDEHPQMAAGPADRCVFALPGELASYRRLVLPFADKSQVTKTLRFALEAEVPYDLDDMVLGWRVGRVTDKTEVLTVTSRHDTLKSWIGALAQRSLDPERVFVDTELLGLVGGGPEVSGGNVAVVDVGHTHTAIGVLVAGRLTWCRTVSVAGYAFTRAIQTALQCEWAEAESRKHGTFTADDEPTDPSRSGSGYSTLPPPAREAMDGAVGLLLAELRSTLLLAEDDLGLEIDEIRLTGGGASFPELWDYVATDLGVPVRTVGLVAGEPVPPGWNVCQAAAVALIKRHDQLTDLRLGDLAFRGGTDLLRAGLIYGTAGAAFFVFAAVLVFAFQYRSLAVEQRAAEEELAELVKSTFPEAPEFSETSSAVAYVREFTADAVQRAELLGEGAGGVPPTVDALARLTQAFPPHPTVTVTVNHLTLSPESIQLEGETDGYASSAAIEEALQQNPAFASAEKGDDTKAGSRVKFPITIPLGEAPATSEKK